MAATLGIEFSDAGFLTALCAAGEPQVVAVPDANGATDWPGFCFHEGTNFTFGRSAEDNWFVHPRRVLYTFWTRLAHEPSPLNTGAKPPSFSQLAYFFLREFSQRLEAAAGPYDQLVFALPGGYLKDPVTAEEKIGLLLGMANDLKLPLAGMIDLGCAALCDPRASGFNPALPVVLIDLHLEGTDLTLFTTDGKLERRDYFHLPQVGYAQVLKHLTSTMGNRFLRQTTFDILEDGRIEQTFFRQTKDFFLQGTPEFRFHINTATRGYEMIAKKDQLATDTQSFVSALVQGVQTFIHNSPHASEPCTVALSDRTARLPGLEVRLRAAGFSRLLRLPPGAAACGAACIGARRLAVPADVTEVPVETAVPISDTQRSAATKWDARLQKARATAVRLPPTHAILNGVGHPIGAKPKFTIGNPDVAPDVPLPDVFGSVDDCAVPLVNENGRLWFVDAAPGRNLTPLDPTAPRIIIEAGDRLTIHCGNASAEILFAHCPPTNGAHQP